ncbi:hypothetical protein [Dyella sp. 20L07]|uniref:hypothetical protein n=1 Tax=Dyella sp. 20L07 TaxID=3384240 RepID=UPI003D27CE5A
MALTFSYLLSEVPSFFAGMQHINPKGGMPADMFRLQSRMMMINPLMFVIGLAGRALLMGAVYRSMLEPDNRRFFSLRFGTQELWLALGFVVYGAIVAFAFVGAMLGGSILGGLAWLIGSLITNPVAAVVVRVVLIGSVVIAAMGAWIWLAVRLCLGPVMIFAKKEFLLDESWAFTKGHVRKLAGLCVTLGIMAFTIALTVECIILAITYVQLGGFDQAHLQAFFPQGQTPNMVLLLRALAPAFALGFVLVGPMFAILGAPLASAYMDLTRREVADIPALP